MNEFVFTSPGVKFKERDLTYVTQNVGVTTLGLVGETLKGPAFEPIFIQNKNQFSSRFGGQSIKRFNNGNLKFQLPYVANSYLEESNQLWVTRVLGLSGYDAGNAWVLKLNAGLDPSTVITGGIGTQGTESFENNVYRGVTINNNGETGISFSGFSKIDATNFTGVTYSFEVTAYSASTGGGMVSYLKTDLSGTSYQAYDRMALGIIRSKGRIVDEVNAAPTMVWDVNNITINNNTTNIGSGDFFGEFTLTVTGNSNSGSYVVSLNPNSTSFISNVIGKNPNDKNSHIWVESTYPDLYRKLDGDGELFPTNLAQYGISGISPYAYGVISSLNTIEGFGDVSSEVNPFRNYKTQFTTPETPWIVSQVNGNLVNRLFKFILISDGNSANEEIKISITNVNIMNYEFDVLIRDFYDTDDNIKILESYSRCNLIKTSNNYIGRRIGTFDGQYDAKSNYVMVEMNEDIVETDFPCGFEGYLFTSFNRLDTYSNITPKQPKIFYKTQYGTTENLKRTFLGISEKGYNTVNQTGFGFNQNYFNFNGIVGENTHTKTKGFHMDVNASGVTSNGYSFDCGVGKIQSIDDVVSNSQNPYFNIVSRKFTVVPYGGFDGWDIHRIERSYGDNYKQYGIYDGVSNDAIPNNDYQAWHTAINTFANPEDVSINLFSTPGINWFDQNLLIKDVIEMIETQRTDALYVIDCPDVTITQLIGDNGKADIIVANEIAELLESADIDSSYCCTYFPYIQMKDIQNNVNIYIPPTGEVVKAMAYTDNVKYPWWAPAGLNRGTTNAKRSKYKLSLEARDVLYAGRINPLADFADTGTAIFGQKTLQIKESALDRINVRRLLLQVKVLISNIAVRLLFEQNDQTTIDQFLTKVNPILDTIKRERGLSEFKVKMDDSINTPETLDRNELYGEIYIKPTPALEKIGITFTITPSGASFSDV